MTAQSYKIMTAHQLGEELKGDIIGAEVLRYLHSRGWGGFMIQVPIQTQEDMDAELCLSEYKGLIQQGLNEGENGAALKEKVITYFGADHAEIRECERLIRMESFKRKAYGIEPCPSEQAVS